MITPLRRGALRRPAAIALATLLASSACGDDGGAPAAAGSEPVGEAAFPVTVDNCGVEVAVDAAPERAVTMNQAATEVMLALGLEDHLAGTAYLDDEILPALADAYASVPVLADGYPSTEVLFDAEPDFVYGSYASAFGDEASGDRDHLADLGIGSYLSIGGCPDLRESGVALEFDDVFDEIRDVAALFGVGDRAEALIAEQRAAVDGAVLASDETLTVMWWDGNTDAPTVGVCCGAPGMLMRSLGVDNLYGAEPGSWATISWEQVAADDPDIIVLVDADWDTAADKLAHLRADPALADLTAVIEERTVVVPFSATTPGVRNADALAELADAIRSVAG